MSIEKTGDNVDSVYGNISRDKKYVSALSDFVRHAYSLVPIGVEPAKRGYYGETWKLSTAERSYFLKLDYSVTHSRCYARSFPIMEHLRIHGIDFISQIVRTAEGKLYARFDGATLGVFNWIDGENIQNERTKGAAYRMLAKIYTVPADRLMIPSEDFSAHSAELFFSQWGALDDLEIRMVLGENREKIARRAKRLEYFAARCRGDTAGYAITHGDAGGNVIVSGGTFHIVDWDNPMLAPPERDAWFCLHWGWAMDTFSSELRKNGVDYTLRTERLAYYCYHSFFFYLTEYMTTYSEIGNRGGNMAVKLRAYFDSWIEDEIQYADNNF